MLGPLHEDRLTEQVWGLRGMDSLAVLHSTSSSPEMPFRIQELIRSSGIILKTKEFPEGRM